MAISGHQRSSEAIRGHQRPSEAIRGHQRSSEVIRGRQRSSEVVRGRQRSSEVIRGRQRSSEVIRGHQRSSEVIRGHQRPSEVVRGPQRSSEVIRGHQRSSEVIRGHQRPSEVVRGPQRSSEVIRGHQRPSEAITCVAHAHEHAILMRLRCRGGCGASGRCHHAVGRRSRRGVVAGVILGGMRGWLGCQHVSLQELQQPLHDGVEELGWRPWWKLHEQRARVQRRQLQPARGCELLPFVVRATQGGREESQQQLDHLVARREHALGARDSARRLIERLVAEAADERLGRELEGN